MPNSFTARLPLARAAVDRDAATREQPGLASVLVADPATRILLLRSGDALLATAEPPVLALLPPSALSPEVIPPETVAQRLLYLGRALDTAPDLAAGAPVAALELTDAEAAELAGGWGGWGDLRRLGADLSARDAGLFTEALALVNWHRASAFSPRTGAPTVSARGGWVRHPSGSEQESSGQHVFPRTDPAVIVGVVDDQDRILLANGAAWPEGRFSVVAGFVEPGESFEATVVREVFEEVGVHAVDPVYLGSQPWPFPASVMVGFLARTAPGVPADIRVDGVEIRAARWFSRDELRQAAGDTVLLPMRTSIARAIIEHWFGEPIEGDRW